MISAVNHQAIPFFERVPSRAIDVVSNSAEIIRTIAAPAENVHFDLCAELKRLNVTPPTFDEFKTWFDEVKRGRINPVEPPPIKPYEPVAKAAIERAVMDCFVSNPASGEVVRPIYAMAMDTRTRKVDLMERPVTWTDRDPAALAYEIIARQAALTTAMLVAGYSPESCSTEDSIVAEAIESWLEAQAVKDGTPAATLALQLLDNLDDAGNEKLLGVLANCMQAELIRAIVVQEGGEL
ncbi:MAG: hypothetical protein DI537_20740 [Stutzerimonas stutzeri]|nr:MAG: hypothetical protein DI537_20740 [Stutzerimonas stutzeri]